MNGCGQSLILCYNQLEQRRHKQVFGMDVNALATGCEAKTQAYQEIITTEEESLPSYLDNLTANDPAENHIQ